MDKVPSYLRTLVAEGGGDVPAVHNELLLALIDTLSETNAILDDTIHHELNEMKRSMKKMAGNADCGCQSWEG